MQIYTALDLPKIESGLTTYILLCVNKVIKSCLKIQTLAMSNPSVYSALGLIGEVVFLNVRDNNLSQITNGYLTIRNTTRTCPLIMTSYGQLSKQLHNVPSLWSVLTLSEHAIKHVRK